MNYYATSAQAPVFSCEKLKIWFVQFESVFRVNSIETDDEMYDHIVANIPAQYTSLVEDIITDPPAIDSYNYIKTELLKRMSKYNMDKVTFGSEKPSKYLEELHKLGDEQVSDEYVIKKWLSILPEPIGDIVSLESSGDLKILGKMADKAMAMYKPTHPQQELISPDQLKIVKNQIQELKKKMRELERRLGEGY